MALTCARIDAYASDASAVGRGEAPQMQVLMSQAAQARIASELEAIGSAIDVVTLAPDGSVSRGGTLVDDTDPEAFWLSLDMYAAGQLPRGFQSIMQGGRGEWVQVFNAGLDNPAFRLVMSKGLRLTKSDAQAPAIAEYVLAHTLSLLHPIDRQRAAQAAHSWTRVPFREVGSTRWLLVGFGAIGRAVAERIKPFGAHVTVVRRTPAPDPLADDVRGDADLHALLPDADVVVLACPLTAETRGLAGEAFFAAMKPGAILVNIGRGGLLDEAALRASLDRDQPAHAVLDVFETEPLPADSWLWDHPKVRVSAHTSNAGDGLVARGDALFLENLKRYLAGAPLLNEAHPGEVGL